MEPISKVKILSANGIQFDFLRYPDGDVVFWSDELSLEFKSNEFEKIFGKVCQTKATNDQPPKDQKAGRRVRKESAGWAVDMRIGGETATWYYKTRSAARSAKPSDVVGDGSGRIG